jgi:hypothetical protein
MIIALLEFMLEFMARERVHCCNIAFSCSKVSGVKVPRRLAQFQTAGK